MLRNVNESQDFLDKQIIDKLSLCGLHNNNDKKIIEELCELHEKESFKGSFDSEFISSIEKYLTRNQLKSEDLINLCLNNQSNSILLTILARCYRYGKW
ncbi:14869_t:CDS:1, partial [Racocetra fulgida]